MVYSLHLSVCLSSIVDHPGEQWSGILSLLLAECLSFVALWVFKFLEIVNWFLLALAEANKLY